MTRGGCTLEDGNEERRGPELTVIGYVLMRGEAAKVTPWSCWEGVEGVMEVWSPPLGRTRRGCAEAPPLTPSMPLGVGGN